MHCPWFRINPGQHESRTTSLLVLRSMLMVNKEVGQLYVNRLKIRVNGNKSKSKELTFRRSFHRPSVYFRPQNAGRGWKIRGELFWGLRCFWEFVRVQWWVSGRGRRSGWCRNRVRPWDRRAERVDRCTGWSAPWASRRIPSRSIPLPCFLPRKSRFHRNKLEPAVSHRTLHIWLSTFLKRRNIKELVFVGTLTPGAPIGPFGVALSRRGGSNSCRGGRRGDGGWCRG